MSAIPFSLTDSAQVVPAGTPCTLLGWSLGETAGDATAAINIRDGDDGGPIVAVVGLAIDGTSTEFLGGQGVRCYNGIYVEVVSGAVAGAVYHQ